MMESDKTYEESYKVICNLLKQCTCDSISIDFTKLDKQTAGELRQAIDKVLLRRKKEVGVMIVNTIK